MEVESKFNPDDWNGYLHTYETIEEYNAARKLLPHTARIESTKEAKYISREELPVRYMYIDNINNGSSEITNSNDLNDFCEWAQEHYFSSTVARNKVYKLIGKINIRQTDYYLWELIEEYGTTPDNYAGVWLVSDLYRYVVTTTMSLGSYLNPEKLEGCAPILINLDDDAQDYVRDWSMIRADHADDVLGHGDRLWNIIFFILEERV